MSALSSLGPQRRATEDEGIKDVVSTTMPGYVIGLILFAVAAATFVLLLQNSLRFARDEEERPRLRRRILLAMSGPAVLLAVALVVLASLS